MRGAFLVGEEVSRVAQELVEGGAAETLAPATSALPAETLEAAGAVVTPETALTVWEQLAQLFTKDGGFMGWWLVGGGVLIAVLLVLLGVAVALVLRKKNGAKAAPAKETQVASPAIGRTLDTAELSGQTEQSAAGGFDVGAISCIGARSGQQDSYDYTPEEIMDSHGILAVVCDGMGGLSDGDKMSKTAVDAVMNNFLRYPDAAMEPLMWELLRCANVAVNKLVTGAGQSGTTMVMGLLKKQRFLWCSVGDSRILLHRGGQFIQLNREHVYKRTLCRQAVNSEVELQEAFRHPKGGGLTSYLGMGSLQHVDMPARPLMALPGDTFLLMSDGVYNAISETEMESCMAGSAQEIADAIGKTVADKNHAGQDNYTCVVLKA